MPNKFVFVIKASKFCNLRCGYCYEHAELNNKATMSFETLRRLFVALNDFERYLRTSGLDPQFEFVWHGGEPLILPREFYCYVEALQREVLQQVRYRNAIQTNLYSYDEELLFDLLSRNYSISISIDFVNETRVNRGARPSNDKVLKNAETLKRRGIDFSVLTVLNKFNLGCIEDAYYWVRSNARGWRLLPIFTGGPNSQEEYLDDHQIFNSYQRIYELRQTLGDTISIDPLDTYFRIAALSVANIGSGFSHRAIQNVFLINVDGGIYFRPFAYDKRYEMGNINDYQDFSLVLSHQKYVSSTAKMYQRQDGNCENCSNNVSCDRHPFYEHGSLSGEADLQKCVVPRKFIEYLRADIEFELTPSELRHLLLESLTQGTGVSHSF
ncbi:radical SAM protein [Rhizobium ruizarguesonis]